MAIRYGRTLITKFDTVNVSRRLLTAWGKAMSVVAREMEEEIRASIQKPYPPASKPGNPPHRRSGYLAGSVTGTGDQKGIRIHEAQYGRFLEGGTARMDPRPHVLPVLFTKSFAPRKKWEKRIAQLAKEFSR